MVKVNIEKGKEEVIKAEDNMIIKDENKVEVVKGKTKFSIRYYEFKRKVEIFVESKAFNIFIIVIIMINSIFLSLVYYEMPYTLQ